MNKIRESRLKILNYSVKSLWLLLLPLIRALLAQHADIDFFLAWITGAWFDMLVLFAVILLGYIRWGLREIYTDDDNIILTDRFIIRKKMVIPFMKFSSVTSQQNVFLRIFKIVRVSVDTSGGTERKTDLSLLLRKKDWIAISGIVEYRKTDCIMKFKYTPTSGVMLLFSFIFSSSVSGAVYIAAVFMQLGRTAGDLVMSYRDSFEQLTETMAESLALKIPPIGISIGLFIIGLKLFSFTINLLRYAHFQIENNKSILRIKSGAIGKREFIIIPKKINYADLGQNLLMKIFGVTSIHINCAGYGNKKSEIPVFLPIMSSKDAEQTLKRLSINGGIRKVKYRPKITAVFRYIFPALTMIAGLFIAAFIMRRIFPFYKDTIRFFAWLFAIPAVWNLTVKVVSVFTTGFIYLENNLYISCNKGLKFHNITVKKCDVVKTVIYQNILQKKFKKCDVVFYLRSDKPKKFKIKSIPNYILYDYNG